VPGTKSSTINSASKSLPGYPNQQVVNVLESGTIWVYTNTAAVQDGVVALLDAGGDVVVASGTANSSDIKARFLANAAAGELVPIQLGDIGLAPEPAAA
jgi:ribonuclease PH